MSDPSAAPGPAQEIQRPFPLRRIGAGTSMTVEAGEAEREALARRMGLPAIHSLLCHFDLVPGEARDVGASGLLRARIRQTCVVSLEDFDSEIIEDFSVRFVPEGSESDDFDLDAEDEIPYCGDAIDLGAATSEQLALALDPFPRKPGAEIGGSRSGKAENAFAALGKLLPPK